MKISGIYRSKNDFWKILYIGQYLISYIGQYTTISILTDIWLHISYKSLIKCFEISLLHVSMRHHCFPKFTTVIEIRLADRLFSWMTLEWVFCFIYTCTENVRSIFDDIRRLDWYEMLRCGTVQIVPNCLPDVYFIIYLMFTLSSHYITLPRSYSIIEHVMWSHLMSCDDHVTHREDLSYSNNVFGDRWTNDMWGLPSWWWWQSLEFLSPICRIRHLSPT